MTELSSFHRRPTLGAKKASRQTEPCLKPSLSSHNALTSCKGREAAAASIRGARPAATTAKPTTIPGQHLSQQDAAKTITLTKVFECLGACPAMTMAPTARDPAARAEGGRPCRRWSFGCWLDLRAMTQPIAAPRLRRHMPTFSRGGADARPLAALTIAELGLCL